MTENRPITVLLHAFSSGAEVKDSDPNLRQQANAILAESTHLTRTHLTRK
jgi:hypothetical protein